MRRIDIQEFAFRAFVIFMTIAASVIVSGIILDFAGIGGLLILWFIIALSIGGAYISITTETFT